MTDSRAPQGEIGNCGHCGGAGKLIAFIDGRDKKGKRFGGKAEIDCLYCRGTGRVSADMHRRYEIGREARRKRVERGQSLLEAAAEQGLTSAQLSAFERGHGPDEAYAGKEVPDAG